MDIALPLQKLVESGLLGILLVLSLFGLAYIYRVRDKDREKYQTAINDLQEKRIAEAKEIKELVATPLEAQKETLELVVDTQEVQSAQQERLFKIVNNIDSNLDKLVKQL